MIRKRSKKMAKLYREERVPFVKKFLEEHPWCQRCLSIKKECTAMVRFWVVQRSTEVHELISRARGGSITDSENCVALCHDCHSWVHDRPKQATADGWLKKRKIGA